MFPLPRTVESVQEGDYEPALKFNSQNISTFQTIQTGLLDTKIRCFKKKKLSVAPFRLLNFSLKIFKILIHLCTTLNKFLLSLKKHLKTCFVTRIHFAFNTQLTHQPGKRLAYDLLIECVKKVCILIL